MSIFNNYRKPGPGVAKNSEYEVNRFALYFQLLGRKFWNLCILSLTMTLYTIPFLALGLAIYKLLGTVSFFVEYGFQFRVILAMLPFGLYGPILSAAFKIGRDFTREEPVFLFSDFWKTVRNNLVQPIVLSAVTYFFFSALTFALPGYMAMAGIGTYVFFPLCLLAFFALLFMQFYIYTMAACFHLSLKDILKNGLIFSFLCILRNVLILIIMLFLLLLCYFLLLFSFSYPAMFGLLFILLACFLPAYFVFSAAFITYPALQKYVVEPYYRANPSKTSSVLNKPVSHEDVGTKEIPEYVYHNGRMVHRSVLESESLFDDNNKIGPDNQQQ